MGKAIYLVSLYYQADVQTGANKRLECLAYTLSQKLGRHVTVIVPAAEVRGMHGSGADIVSVRAGRFGLLSRLGNWLRLVAILRSLPSGVVVSDFMPPVPVFGKHTAYQLIHDVRALDGHRRKAGRSRLVPFVYLFMLRRARRVMTVSQSSAGRIAQAHARAEIVVVPNGLSTAYFSSVNRGGRRFDILCVGTFEQRKNYERAVLAINDLVKMGTKLQCLFIGSDGGDKAKICDLVRRLGLEDTITFGPQIKDETRFIQETYDQAKVYLSPSLYEGFGMTLVEASARGCKVVCSDIEPFRELGLLQARFCDPLSVDSIRTALSEALSDRSTSDHSIRRKYSWDAMADVLIKVTNSG